MPNPELAEYMFPQQPQLLHGLESNGGGGEEKWANSVSERPSKGGIRLDEGCVIISSLFG